MHPTAHLYNTNQSLFKNLQFSCENWASYELFSVTYISRPTYTFCDLMIEQYFGFDYFFHDEF